MYSKECIIKIEFSRDFTNLAVLVEFLTKCLTLPFRGIRLIILKFVFYLFDSPDVSNCVLHVLA